MPKTKAVVLLSGGQDSVTCLGWALAHFTEVVAISFDYGQKHLIELATGDLVAKALSVERHVFKTDILSQLGDSALVTGGDVTQPHPHKEGLPASYVPNRNAFMLTTAHALAQKIGAETIVAGMCETDYSGYPDCRLDFIQIIEQALNSGSEADICIETPLMHLDKAQTFQLADDLGIIELVVEDTVTCYNGDMDTRNPWGGGCGECPACELRAAGYEKYESGDVGPFVVSPPRKGTVGGLFS